MPVKGPSESEIQKAFFQWLSYYPYIRSLTTHIPNGGSRSAKLVKKKGGGTVRVSFEAKRMKAEGVTPGWPDVFMAIPTESFYGLFIEFKSKKGKLTTSQETRMSLLDDQGYAAWACYSLEEAMEAVKIYLGDKWDAKQPTISGKNITAIS